MSWIDRSMRALVIAASLSGLLGADSRSDRFTIGDRSDRPTATAGAGVAGPSLSPVLLAGGRVAADDTTCRPLTASKAPTASAPSSGPFVTRDAVEKAMQLHYGDPKSRFDKPFLDSLPQSYPPGSSGATAAYGPTTGAQGAIGINPDFAALAVITAGDPRTLGYLKANVHCASVFPYHLKNAAGRTPMISEAPFGDTNKFTQVPGAPGVVIDIQHQTHPYYVYALMTTDEGERDFAIEEMKARVAYDVYYTNPAGRMGVGLTNLQNSTNGGRGTAWSWVAKWQLYHALILFRPNDPWLVDGSLRNAIEMDALYVVGELQDGTWVNMNGTVTLPGGKTMVASAWDYPTPRGWGVNRLGLFSMGKAGPDGDTPTGELVVVRAFMQSFLCQAALWINGIAPQVPLSDAARAAVRRNAGFAAQWVVGLLGPADTPGAFDYRFGIALYNIFPGIARADGGMTVFADFGTLFEANRKKFRWPDLGPDDHVLRSPEGGPLERIGDGSGANLLAAAALAEQQGWPGAAAARARVMSSVQGRRHDVAVQFAFAPLGEIWGADGSSANAAKQRGAAPGVPGPSSARRVRSGSP